MGGPGSCVHLHKCMKGKVRKRGGPWSGVHLYKYMKGKVSEKGVVFDQGFIYINT